VERSVPETTKSLTAKSLHPLFAAELSGIDISKPLNRSDVAAIEAAILRYAVVVFRPGRPLTNEQHIAFSANFGTLQKQQMLQMLGKTRTRLPYLELIDVGNLDVDGKILPDDDRRRAFGKGNQLWHVDVSFDAQRATYSMLSAHVVPPGGADTEYADMRAAYDALPAAKKVEIEGLVAEHSIWYSRALMGLTDVTEAEMATRPPARHRLVHIRAGSTRKSLYLASHASHIVGWPREKGRALLEELTAFATRPEFVYCHKWRPGDLVIWDNLATMHRGTPFDDTLYPRDMRRTTIIESAA
jgi:alpha-ketoglutarate-dependent 2,4-dichlorophenoxyacetate dioxygenase